MESAEENGMHCASSRLRILSYSDGDGDGGYNEFDDHGGVFDHDHDDDIDGIPGTCWAQ